MLNIQQHEYYLKRILRDIARDQDLNSKLVFKGGTCLYLFHGLDRFSVDLDFTLISENFSTDKVQQILAKYLDVKNGRFSAGKHGWLWEASYIKGRRKMQIDINKNVYPDKFEVEQFYGLSLRTLDRSSLFAHKLCAILDRKHFQNRDLYDSYFMFDNMFEINEAIIQQRTGKSVSDYLTVLEKYIDNEVDKNRTLQGFGELLNGVGDGQVCQMRKICRVVPANLV